MLMREIIIKAPQQQRSRQKFEAILQACPVVLKEFGYKKATTARIALEADVSIGSVYDYFSCKEAIILAYLDFELDKTLASVAFQARHSQLGIDDTLRAFIQSGIDFAHNQRHVIKIIFTEFPALLQAINLSATRERLMHIAADFAENSQIQLKNRNPELMIYSLTNIILGFQFRIALIQDGNFQREQIVNELHAIISNYLYGTSE